MTALLNRRVIDPEALGELLRSGQVRRAPPGWPDSPGSPELPRAPRQLPLGVPAFDAALGGGLTRGWLHEIIAPPSAGGTALLRAALGAATRAGELCALIDPADAFDPAPSDIDLRRLLWVRPREPAQALRAVEIALEARFALVALDLGALPTRRAPHGSPDLNDLKWSRLGRRAERHGGAVLVLTRSAQAGSFAQVTLELQRGAVRWEGKAGLPGRLLRGASSVGAVARARRLSPSGPLPLLLPLEQR